MNFTLQRFKTGDDGIFSDLIDESGKIVAKCAEHAYNGLPKLVDGTYKCIRYDSPKHKMEVWLVLGVPNADYIELHIGNWPQIDSDGCVLLGSAVAWSSKG